MVDPTLAAMGTGAALVSGMLAGLAVAMPLGAIGVLLVQEGAGLGARRALPGAAAVASVDALYCALALVAGGAAAPLVRAWGRWPALVGGVALLVVAAAGVRRGLVAWPGALIDEPGREGWRRYAVFAGLTAVNPATLVFFAALVAALPAVTTGRPAVSFVVGVGAASFAWQALLVVGGGLLGGRAGPRARRATVVVGNTVVAALGVATLLRALA